MNGQTVQGCLFCRTDSDVEVHSFVENAKENGKSINDYDISTAKSESIRDKGKDYSGSKESIAIDALSHLWNYDFVFFKRVKHTLLCDISLFQTC